MVEIMGRRAITVAVYQQILEAIRQHPEAPTKAAKIAGVTYRTVRRAMEHGFPGHGFRPIRTVLDEEARVARVLRAEQDVAERLRGAELEIERLRDAALVENASERLKAVQEAHAAREQAVANLKAEIERLREASRMDAIDQQADEAKLSRGARKAALALQAMISRCYGALQVLSDKFVAHSTDPNMTPQHTLLMIRELALATKRANEATNLAIQLERLRVGDPTSIVELRSEPRDMEDVARQLAEANRLHEVAQRRLPGRDAKVIPIVAAEPGKVG